MSVITKVSVVGDGGWGTTLAILLASKGCRVKLWSAWPDYARLMERTRRNPRYLKGISIPRQISVTSDAAEVLATDLVVVAVPSEYLRSVLRSMAGEYRRHVPVVSVVKGIENKTFLRCSEVIEQAWFPERLAVLSGPTIAMEVARKIPTTVVAASADSQLRGVVQDLFMTPEFRVYTNPDVTGVELGGSLKNIIAIACGISDGLGFGTNTKAAIVSRGLAEMTRLGIALGGRPETFYGISGLGDLVTTCFNPLSRNHYVGEQIGRGRRVTEVLRQMSMVAEGVPTARSVYQLARKRGVDMPITSEIYRVLFRRHLPVAAVKRLMMRGKKSE